MDLNYYVLLIFAPLLILVGIAGFILPKDKSLTSGATPYNIFHIIFGVIGCVVLLTSSDAGTRTFNVVFGAVDLYQAAASFLGLFTKRQFEWTRVDDLLHVVIGAGLVAIGIFG